MMIIEDVRELRPDLTPEQCLHVICTYYKDRDYLRAVADDLYPVPAVNPKAKYVVLGGYIAKSRLIEVGITDFTVDDERFTTVDNKLFWCEFRCTTNNCGHFSHPKERWLLVLNDVDEEV